MQNETGYRSLKVWQRAMDLTLASYAVVARLPEIEKYDLGSQIRRSAVSVPANIAEGYARDHLGESLHFLAIAAGSLAELQTLLLLTGRLGYIDSKQFETVRPGALTGPGDGADAPPIPQRAPRTARSARTPAHLAPWLECLQFPFPVPCFPFPFSTPTHGLGHPDAPNSSFTLPIPFTSRR